MTLKKHQLKPEDYINRKVTITCDNFSITGVLTDFQNETEKYKITLKQSNGSVGIYFVPNCIKLQKISKR